MRKVEIQAAEKSRETVFWPAPGSTEVTFVCCRFSAEGTLISALTVPWHEEHNTDFVVVVEKNDKNAPMSSNCRVTEYPFGSSGTLAEKEINLVAKILSRDKDPLHQNVLKPVQLFTETADREWPPSNQSWAAKPCRSEEGRRLQSLVAVRT